MVYAKCHPDLPHHAGGLCGGCYSQKRYRTVPGAKAAAYKARYAKISEGRKKDRCLFFTAQEEANLEACLVRRGLSGPLYQRLWIYGKAGILPEAGLSVA